MLHNVQETADVSIASTVQMPLLPFTPRTRHYPATQALVTCGTVVAKLLSGKNNMLSTRIYIYKANRFSHIYQYCFL